MKSKVRICNNKDRIKFNEETALTDPIMQWLIQLTANQEVPGSNPR
jgi:hypothetical protein